MRLCVLCGSVFLFVFSVCRCLLPRSSVMLRKACALFALSVVIATPAAAQSRAEDEYTRYELLAPETSSFKITYDVTAVDSRREVLLQRDPQHDPGERPVGDRSDDGRAAQDRRGHWTAGPGRGVQGCGRGDPLPPDRARAAGARRRRRRGSASSRPTRTPPTITATATRWCSAARSPSTVTSSSSRKTTSCLPSTFRSRFWKRRTAGSRRA